MISVTSTKGNDITHVLKNAMNVVGSSNKVVSVSHTTCMREPCGWKWGWMRLCSPIGVSSIVDDNETFRLLINKICCVVNLQTSFAGMVKGMNCNEDRVCSLDGI